MNFNVLTLLMMASTAIDSSNQQPEILRILNNQVDAFNQRDVERLVDGVTDDFIWFSLTSNEMMVETSGIENFRKSMVEYYQNGRKPHSTIIDYAIDGNRISFKEEVYHVNADGQKVSASAMGIYEIKGDKISRAWYFID